MDYHEVLLKWSQAWTQECISKVLCSLELKGVQTKIIYISQSLNVTIVHLLFEDEYGFRKKYFASSERSGGSNALRKCEVPNKWVKHLQRREIESNLDDMFRDATDLRIHGDSTG